MSSTISTSNISYDGNIFFISGAKINNFNPPPPDSMLKYLCPKAFILSIFLRIAKTCRFIKNTFLIRQH